MDGCSAGFVATYDYNKTTRHHEVTVSDARYDHNHELNQRTWRRDPVTRKRLWDDDCEVTTLLSMMDLTHPRTGKMAVDPPFIKVYCVIKLRHKENGIEYVRQMIK